MARYRVGEGGVRILPARGAPYSLPPGVELDEIPHQYEGTLEVVALDEVQSVGLLDRPVFRKRLGGYEDKVIRPAEDKAK
jgi:hypothetical protein